MRSVAEGLSPVLRRLYDLFSKNEGRVVVYADIAKVYHMAGTGRDGSARIGRANLGKNIQLLRAKLRNSPVRIDNVPRIGYRLRLRKQRMRARKIEINENTIAYATELQAVLGILSDKHDTVTFRQQLSMLGATIGMILLQIPPEHRVHYHNLIVANMKGADELVTDIVLH